MHKNLIFFWQRKMKRGLGTIGEGVGIENTSQNSQNKNLDK